MSDEARTSKEKVSRDLAQQIRCAAIRMKCGVVLSMDVPARHHTILHAVAQWLGRTVPHGDQEQGFLTATGKFIDREHAARLCGRDGKLFSEDLW